MEPWETSSTAGSSIASRLAACRVTWAASRAPWSPRRFFGRSLARQASTRRLKACAGRCHGKGRLKRQVPNRAVRAILFPWPLNPWRGSCLGFPALWATCLTGLGRRLGQLRARSGTTARITSIAARRWTTPSRTPFLSREVMPCRRSVWRTRCGFRQF